MCIRVIILSFLDVIWYCDHDCNIYDRFVTTIISYYITITVVTVIYNIILFFFTKFKIRKEISLLSLDITSPSRFLFSKTNFHLCQFLFSFLRYSFLNFPLFHLYSIFAMYFSSNFPFLKSHSFATFNFFYFLTSILVFLSKFATTSFAFPKSFSLFYMLYFAINPF